MSRDIATQVADDGVATLTLSRPERRNALSIELRDELTEQLDGWASDPAIRAVVLTGAGSTFCAGFDLDEFAQADLATSIRDSSRRYHLAVWQFPKPLVAAVNGPAVAGGMDLCVLCDIRIASATAVFGHPEIKFGAPPLFTPLQWIVGMGVARELCLTGRRIDAHEALRIGLVNSISEPARLLDDAVAVARAIIEAPQAALEYTKRYLISSPGATFERTFAVEHDAVFEDFLRGAVGPRSTP
ncbi:enoyl-CoA hydratase/isomerase family protein [Mycobacterium shinjukuense]|uniref:Enoyl-CoA hydratase n=1 Tax=Mycobacterium shinjukuense TaxID=398694 RepID=A0A7I7MMQ2_9MYCO|nr:enoyl-CoA hydratase/isomerase family protein [Mycobacterium shinjukuense]MCV6984327.1 enoyl-CoA hydratase/isomerase family protein [Mycobacterium shinjukuense]ORB70940.1 enoyl-CoA hydratase [Mycobacterium shinjukuense]BBX73047.1 enoyl-CoA hydratase [Mycobacterium shinjukuense]